MLERPDAHEKPPKVLQDVYKFYQKVEVRKLEEATCLSAHLNEAARHKANLAPRSMELPVDLQQLLEDFSNLPAQARDACVADESKCEPKVFEICGLPGE
jgi:hypothetical protein